MTVSNWTNRFLIRRSFRLPMAMASVACSLAVFTAVSPYSYSLDMLEDGETAAHASLLPTSIFDSAATSSSQSDFTLDALIEFANTPDIPLLSQQVKPLLSFNRDSVLDDYDKRISEEFAIPENMRDRVGFWFDVYTLYSSNQRVIHHSRYPWIVFKVIDVAPILNADSPRVQWLRNEKADKFVKGEVRKIREAIASLTKKKTPAVLNEYQLAVTEALSHLKGPLRKRANEALHEVRVQTGQRDFFEDGLTVGPLYLTGMEEIFRENKIPIELTRIPFVESSFNKHATSKVGASGVWQFMNSTGRSFMIVDGAIDERRSPFKASEAAAHLLKENHLILHKSWPLAITAWNHGPPGIRKAIHEAHSQDLGEIIARYHSKSFDFASSNFYSEFLAALHAERYNAEIFGPLNAAKALDLHSVKLSHSISAKKLLLKSALSEEDFVLFNPDLKTAIAKNSSVPAGFRLMLNDSARLVLKDLVSTDTRRVKKARISSADVSAINIEMPDIAN